MINPDDRCQRCGRIMSWVEESTQSGYQDAWQQCLNPKCIEASRAEWAAWEAEEGPRMIADWDADAALANKALEPLRSDLGREPTYAEAWPVVDAARKLASQDRGVQ